MSSFQVEEQGEHSRKERDQSKGTESTRPQGRVASEQLEANSDCASALAAPGRS